MPVPSEATTGTTGQPSSRDSAAASTRMPLASATSTMFSTTSSGTRISASWVVR